ncbi:hypothetical protein FPOAC2_13495 [Fusarium poae]|jgi:ankyrin repeat protein
MALLALPPELYYIIAAFLGPRELAALLRTSKQTYPIVQDILYNHDVENNNPSALLWALRRKRIKTFKYALGALKCHCTAHVMETGCTIQSTLDKALRLASSGGHIDFVQLLLDHGVDANSRSGGRATALELALLHRHEDIIQILVDNNAHR